MLGCLGQNSVLWSYGTEVPLFLLAGCQSFSTSRGHWFLTMQPLHPQRRESSLLSGQAGRMFAGSRCHSLFLSLDFPMFSFIHLLCTHIYEKISSVTFPVMIYLKPNTWDKNSSRKYNPQASVSTRFWEMGK